MGRYPGLKRCLQAISTLRMHCASRPRCCPPSPAKRHLTCWAKLMWWHSIGIFQAYQADLLRNLDEGDGLEVASKETTHCPLWFSTSSSTGADAMVQMWQRLHLYTFLPDLSAPASSRGSLPGQDLPAVSSPFLASLSVVHRPFVSPAWLSCRRPVNNLSSPTRDVKALGFAPERDQLLNSGLSSQFVETILNSRAPSGGNCTP